MAYLAVILLIGASVYNSNAAVVYPRANDIETCSRPLDLILVIDSSGSVTSIWNHTIDFTEKLLSNFNIADDLVRVSLIEFSMVANALIPLDSGNNLGRLYQSLEEARSRPQNGETHTDQALNLAVNVFRSAPRQASVPKVLVVITDGELTSGNFSDLDTSLADLAYQNVEVFTVSQGDDLVDEGLQKMASKPMYTHRFSLTPNAMNVPYATQSLASAICNAQPKSQPIVSNANGDAKEKESTTIMQVQNNNPPKQQDVQQTVPSSNSQWRPQGQTYLQEGAWHQNLQQPVGNPKQTYPENPLPQPMPSLPVTNVNNNDANLANAGGKVQSNSGGQDNTQALQCSVNVTKVGCYRDFAQVPRPLPVKLFEEKENNFHVGVKSALFNKQAWLKFLPDFVCRCAKKAREMKFWTFGIQNYNECYSGPDEGRYDEDGDAEPTKCKDEASNDCNQKSKFCSGEDQANYIYTILSDSHKAIVRIEYA